MISSGEVACKHQLQSICSVRLSELQAKVALTTPVTLVAISECISAIAIAIAIAWHLLLGFVVAEYPHNLSTEKLERDKIREHRDYSWSRKDGAKCRRDQGQAWAEVQHAG